MRIRELLREDYQSQLNSDVTNILVGAKGQGIDNIPTTALVQQLQKMGYSVDVDSLISLLQDNPAVQNASPEGIRLNGTDGSTDTAGSPEDTEMHVDSLAQKATQKSIK